MRRVPLVRTGHSFSFQSRFCFLKHIDFFHRKSSARGNCLHINAFGLKCRGDFPLSLLAAFSLAFLDTFPPCVVDGVDPVPFCHHILFVLNGFFRREVGSGGCLEVGLVGFVAFSGIPSISFDPVSKDNQ